ncbi:CsgG/HfaB family protein [Sphingomonas sp. RP10(2022)]|uniref:CsgG/HfaB family protein n=1 Tax=Sphingomonas liriopis TaxID=2949094 RepID=A0A9X2HQK7_9SPHN|nr:CsgG/HfaB family protein [Sphingomonas liriopis]MCP3734657.1 CsgG/HfaB family protein [Sphingomonas liriopis]
MRHIVAPIVLAVLVAAPAGALAQKAKVDNSKTSRALAALPRVAGEKPVVAIYDVRSAVPEIQPRAANEMFMTALIKSGAFRVAERTRLNEGVGRERSLIAAGTTAMLAGAGGVPAPVPSLPYAAARYVFEVVVSEAAVGADKHDNSFSLGGAQLDHKGSRDVIGIDIRITDVQTGLVMDAVNTSTQVEARAKQVSGLNALAGRLLQKAGAGGVPLGADARISTSHQDGIDRALRVGMEAGVAELVRRLAPAS